MCYNIWWGKQNKIVNDYSVEDRSKNSPPKLDLHSESSIDLQWFDWSSGGKWTQNCCRTIWNFTACNKETKQNADDSRPIHKGIALKNEHGWDWSALIDFQFCSYPDNKPNEAFDDHHKQSDKTA